MYIPVAVNLITVEDLRMVDGVTYVSFREACYALGLLDDDKQFIYAFKEASLSSAFYMRILFVILLWTKSMACPDFVWQHCWTFMKDDIQHTRRRILQHPDLILSAEQLEKFALEELE
ncbi:unnamed protein product [Cuscuta epithymum]|uniref:Uncharacterized protein n=1 Tax=Cuscuta epithymum TaxID=186058 RepID=A0AAV0F3N4_9ASTE|nr:unnamed protein product [Cuscuta epithymum]CAH9130080.1 unnamed protein product [Cuscuta epithymum]